MDKCTIEIDIEEVAGEFRYCASVKEMPGCFAEAAELQTLFSELYLAMGSWMDAVLDNKEINDG